MAGGRFSSRGLRARAMGLALLLASGLQGGALAADPELLFEPATGRVLHAVEPDRLWYPASVTKLMTAYLTFKAVAAGRAKWDGEVALSTYARIQPASRIGLRGGIKINLEQALLGLVLRSANDFAVAIAEHIEGDEGSFVQEMNRTARRMGMTRTRFKNPHGLPDDEQVTTARDMAILTTRLLEDFPDRVPLFSTMSFQIHRGTFHNANDLLRTLEGADGLKTGFTCASGYNVVASATRNGRRLVAIVFGAANRVERSKLASQMIEAGFSYLAAEDPVIAQAPSSTAQGGVAPASAITTSAVARVDKEAEIAAEPEPTAGAGAARASFTPVLLKDLPLSPRDAGKPHDAALDQRMRKCPGSGRHARREVTSAAKPRAPTRDAVAKAERRPVKKAGARPSKVVSKSTVENTGN